MQFNRNTIRLGLGLIAAFYVIVGGLFTQAYIPAARFNAAVEASAQGEGYDYSGSSLQDALSAEANDAKVRRYGAILLWGTVGLAVFGGVVPKEEIVRATSDLNKKIYERLVSMGVGKLDIVRITVEAAVEGGRLVFGEPKIEWFVPHSEVQKKVEECEKKIAEIRQRIEALLKELP